MTDSCTHIRTYTDPGKSTHACAGGQRTTEGGEWLVKDVVSARNWSPENLSVAGQARAKIKTKAEHRINVGCSEKTG